MFAIIHKLLKRSTSKNIAVNSTGSYLNAAFTLFFTLILTRVLTRGEYGIQSVILTVTYLFANIFDFGISACIYSYLPLYKKDRKNLLMFIKSNVLTQLTLSLIIIVLMIPFIPIINFNLLKTNTPNWFYIAAYAGIPLYILQNSVLNTLYASTKFVHANLLINGSNLLKTISILILVFINYVNMGSIIIVFSLLGPLFFICLAFLSKPGFVVDILKAPFNRRQIRLRYASTYFGASQLFNIATRADLFIVSYFLPASSVGLYALAQKIILNLVVFVSSITQVLAPQFSVIKTRRHAIRQVKKSLAFLSIPGFLFFILIFIPKPVYHILFTEKYTDVKEVVSLLAVSYIFFSYAHAPVEFLLYTVRKPIYILISNAVFLFIIAVGSVILISNFLLLGPPIAFLIANIVTFIYIVVVYSKELHKLKK